MNMMSGMRRKTLIMMAYAMAIGKATSQSLSTKGQNWKYYPIPEHIFHPISGKQYYHIKYQ
jgi:hypothetical protein